MKRDLTLKLIVRHNRVARLSVNLPKVDVTQLLARRSAEEGQSLLPSLFSICAQAQNAAAWGALIGAGNADDLKEHEMMLTLAVQVENLQENLRSLTFNLPESLRDMAMMGRFAQAWRDSSLFLNQLRRSIQQNEFTYPDSFRKVLNGWNNFCAEFVFGDHAVPWLKKIESVRTLSGLAPTPVLQWFRYVVQEIPTLGRIITLPLPLNAFHRGAISWEELTSQPYEASTWLRAYQEPAMAFVIERFGNNAASRIGARIVDVARTLTILFGDYDSDSWIKTYRSEGDYCVAEVQCARGILMHRARVENGAIVSYDICAPTDWTLHKNGAISTLIGISATDRERLHRHATWLVQSLDPCVAFDVEICEEA